MNPELTPEADTPVPLHCLPLLTLADLGTSEADRAIEVRGHGFHEAGHVWAAWCLSLDPGTASITSDAAPYVASRHSDTRWIAAMGWLVQGTAIAADGCLYQGEFLGSCLDEIDAYTCWEHIWDVKQGACCCRRSGERRADDSANDLLDDESWIWPQVVKVVDDWARIEALAVRLMSGEPLPEQEVLAVLNRA